MDTATPITTPITADQVRAIWQQYLSLRCQGNREQLAAQVAGWIRRPNVFADPEAKMVAELGMEAFVKAGQRLDALLEYVFSDPLIH